MDNITDTNRLNWLLGFIGLDQVYDHDDAPPLGPCVDEEGLIEALENTGLFKVVKEDIGEDEVDAEWERRCIIKGIDHAIREERLKNEN